MSVNGDMDGIYKPLRSAVSYFHALGATARDPLIHPVLLLPGQNHLSIVSDPTSLFFYKQKDLLETISHDQAHDTLAALVTAFIDVHSRLSPGTEAVSRATSLIADHIDSSRRALKPMLSLLELEANEQLRRPCDSDIPSPHCPWYAQVRIMEFRIFIYSFRLTSIPCHGSKDSPRTLIVFVAIRGSLKRIAS